MFIGWRNEPIHHATLHEAVQEDSGGSKEAASLCPNGGFLRNGEHRSTMNFMRGGQSLLQGRDALRM